MVGTESVGGKGNRGGAVGRYMGRLIGRVDAMMTGDTGAGEG